MPTTCVALIRGINVGRAKRVAMADLRKLVEGLGARDVRTVLNSGNVVFTRTKAGGRDAAAGLEAALATKLGVQAFVTVLTAAQLSALVAKNPLPDAVAEPSRFVIAFFRKPAVRARLAPLAKTDWSPDALAVGALAAYVRCTGGILESRLAAAVGKALGDGGTTRNWSTVLKLRELASGA
jgi:uncharacterized protein (DUF1697 family)